MTTDNNTAPDSNNATPNQQPKLFKVVMADGTVHECAPFIPRRDRLIKISLGTVGDLEGIWAIPNDEGWKLYQDEENQTRSKRPTIKSQTIMVTLRNHAICWNAKSWGMVLPARLQGADKRPICDLDMIDIPATIEANGGDMPFLMVEASEET